MIVKGDINKIYLHFTYTIIECVKLNRLDIIVKYLDKFNKEFNKNYLLKTEHVENLITLIFVMKTNYYTNRIIFIIDKQLDYCKVICYDNSLITTISKKNSNSVEEIDIGFEQIGYKVVPKYSEKVSSKDYI